MLVLVFNPQRMKRLFFYFCLSTILLWTGSCSKHLTPIEELSQRITNNTATGQILFVETPSHTPDEDFFEISTREGKIMIKGNSTLSLATGLNWYLKYVANVHISWNNLSQSLPTPLPLPHETIHQTTSYKQRYYLNYCAHSYSMPFWDWARWEQEIDWMALHGINLPLNIVGINVVWHNVLQRLGYREQEIDEFIAGPAYQAWWLMNNLEGWGNPKSKSWYAEQKILAQKINHRMRELGITPVIPGYAGMVPSNSAEKLGFEVVNTGKWCAFSRPAFLRTDNPDFGKMASIYYEEVEKLFGEVEYYSMDPFHEGGNTSGVNLAEAGKVIMGEMKKANPKAKWVIQAWQACPYEEMIRDLEKGDLLVLDLYSERRPQWGEPHSEWYRKDGFLHHDWLYCMLLNFGGNVGLHGRMEQVIRGFYAAQRHPQGQHLRGIGTTPEGIENNPIMFELMYELPWRKRPFSGDEWMEGYLQARYGKAPSEEVLEAWRILKNTVYNAPISGSGEGTVESLLCARPGFDLQKTSTWGWARLFYDAKQTQRAAELMLAAQKDFAGNNNFEYDLVDICRQMIADRANVQLKNTSEAYHAKDVERYEKEYHQFLNLILMQDDLLSTRKEFSTDEWVRRAEEASKNDGEKRLFRENALMLITVWGDRAASEGGGLHEYSHREWSGILKSLYYERWKRFFEGKGQELRTGISPQPIDWYEMDTAWIDTYQLKPSKPNRNPRPTIQRIFRQINQIDQSTAAL